MQIYIKLSESDLAKIGAKFADIGKHQSRLLRDVGEALLAVNRKRHAQAVNPDNTPWAPLKPSTLANKRTKLPLKETGQMLSFHYQPDGNTLKIGTSDIKAPWHHQGTKPYTIKPKSKKALKFGGIVRKSVKHPGLPSRKLIGFEPADEIAAKNAILDFLKSRLKM